MFIKRCDPVATTLTINATTASAFRYSVSGGTVTKRLKDVVRVVTRETGWNEEGFHSLVHLVNTQQKCFFFCSVL